jgi:hypothetical protein
MSIEKELILKGIDLSLTVMFGDKIAAAERRRMGNVMIALHAGEITIDQAREQLRPKHGDELDQLLGNKAQSTESGA